MQVRDSKLTPKGYQQITDLDPAVGLTVPAGAQYALIKAEAQAVRWTDDALTASPTTPTTSVGMVIDVGDEFWYTGELTALRFFEDAAGAILNVSYYA